MDNQEGTKDVYLNSVGLKKEETIKRVLQCLKKSIGYAK
jgi:hypothetical protein